MTQNRWFAFLLAGGLMLGSCGSKEEAKNEETATEQTAASTTENNVSTANVETAKTATGPAVAATTLKGFMPSISGFSTEGEAETVQMKMGEVDYSVATQNYKNGDKSIKIVIADYNGAASLTAAYSMMMTMSVETNKEVSKGEKFKGHNGWVTYKKDNSEAQIGVALNDRIWLIAEGDNGTTIDELRSAINSMDLDAIGNAH
jgi:hypothetical protein